MFFGKLCNPSDRSLFFKHLELSSDYEKRIKNFSAFCRSREKQGELEFEFALF
ncbi:MAG: hypothetical protein AVDCRST_MAG74-403 [uncultured Pyrinomonadaceae bacterium]|uniref:Uncharacterized protein n=1 Tax=uncultured Pyrinomonadaceae bacterium TaxID=2283094 RepID=A0A6J4N966_9BACT|nr:MAG: hypothetical protein AVDCRST_MAG74-403 [uncultured Pyrinomonadaceae bacterium]